MVETAKVPDIEIRLVGLDDTFELRKAVLGPWLALEKSRKLYASIGEHFHVGAMRRS